MKKLISLVLVCVLVFAFAVTASADDTTYSYGHFYYHDHDGYVSIAGYLGSETDIEIPSSIAGKPVSEIESGAFDGCGSIEQITVPATVVMVHSNSFTGAGSLRKIICSSEISGITAPAGVEIVQPEVTTSAAAQISDTARSSPAADIQEPVWSDSVSGSSWGNDPIITSASGYEDTTHPVVHSEISQDEDIGDFAYEEDFMPDETDTVITASENETSESRSTTAKDKTTSSVTAAVTVPENIVSVSVNDSGQLVGIDNTGAETVLDESRTYAVEQQPDGSVKIVDEDGAEIVLSEEKTAAEQIAQSEAESDASAPVTENGSFNFVPIIIIAGAAVVVAAVIAVIVLKRKGK